ncbi:MAG: GerMN domain-containing protein [Nitrospirota bacterium]
MIEKKSIAIAIAVLILAGAAGWWATRVYLFQDDPLMQPLIELKGELPKNPEMFGNSEDTVAVKIFYPSEGGVAVVERKVPNSPVLVKMTEHVIIEYLKGLEQDIKDTKLLGVYRDKRNILYIDLSDEFRKGFSGDVRQEYALLSSLYETVMTNIVGVEDVKVLIEGKEVESLGGHFTLLYPLRDVIKEEHQPSTVDTVQLN